MKYNFLLLLCVLSVSAIAQDPEPQTPQPKDYFDHASHALASASLAMEALGPQVRATQRIAAKNAKRVDDLEKYHDELITELRKEINGLKKRISSLEGSTTEN